MKIRESSVERLGKCCSRCNDFKTFEFFSKNKYSKDGHKSACKLCLQADSILYRQNNKDKTKAYWESIKDLHNEKRRQKRKDNPEFYREIDRKRTIQRSKCPKNKSYRANYYQENKERIDANKKVYYETNKERLKKIKLETNRKRYHSDILYRLKIVNRARIGAFFRANKLKKESSSMDLLGCDIETYKNHLQSQFIDGMSWENYGEWEIDHKIPLASAKNVDELNGLCHYLNTQPLWKEENKSKGNKILY